MSPSSSRPCRSGTDSAADRTSALSVAWPRSRCTPSPGATRSRTRRARSTGSRPRCCTATSPGARSICSCSAGTMSTSAQTTTTSSASGPCTPRRERVPSYRPHTHRAPGSWAALPPTGCPMLPCVRGGNTCRSACRHRSRMSRTPRTDTVPWGACSTSRCCNRAWTGPDAPCSDGSRSGGCSADPAAPMRSGMPCPSVGIHPSANAPKNCWRADRSTTSCCSGLPLRTNLPPCGDNTWSPPNAGPPRHAPSAPRPGQSPSPTR